jgi:hypothetical protein
MLGILKDQSKRAMSIKKRRQRGNLTQGAAVMGIEAQK